MLNVLVTGLIATVFAAIHVMGGRLGFLWTVPRSTWLSFAGGISVAYVFVHLLPEMAAVQARSNASTAGALAKVDRHIYLLALSGLAAFYGLERLAGRSQRGAGSPRPTFAFWVHLGSFTLYNVLIGYLLVHREQDDVRGLVWYAVAMALHFVVNDQGLRARHGTTYDRLGRWPLALAPLLGWVLGVNVMVPSLAIGALFAVLAGGVVLNTLKEELPEDRESRFLAFALGAAAYAFLLTVTG